MPLISYREALNDAMREEMQRDSNIFILGEDVGFYGGAFKITEGLFAEFGEKRVIDTPIAEGLIVGAAIGAAMTGLRPIAELMTVNFALLAMDQIVNHAAKIRYMFGGKAKVPLVVRAPGGGGKQLGAQHSQSLESYFLHCPGLKVVMPSTPEDAKGLLKESIRDDDPIVFLEHEHLYNTKGEVP
ncbi:MAG: alpha-ketoacid dehydrogenase subunit beta, partial [Deltaproteobacteria bacterium]|nr:alpha-ketoacid dehydrogenase subunit beta [Deltaproteobacteria bacterium]